MRKILFLYTIALFSLLSVQAQDAGSAYKRANQQYVLFESERDKGANANSMYTYLLEAYNNFIQVTKEQNNVSYINGTKKQITFHVSVSSKCRIVLLRTKGNIQGPRLRISIYRHPIHAYV